MKLLLLVPSQSQAILVFLMENINIIKKALKGYDPRTKELHLSRITEKVCNGSDILPATHRLIFKQNTQDPKPIIFHATKKKMASVL